MDNLNQRVAVYGSLLKGLHNHERIIGKFIKTGEAVFLGKDITKDEFSMYDLGAFPGVTLEPRNQIYTEVYAVSEECLKFIRLLEGVTPGQNDGLYREKTIETKFGDAYIYIFNRDPHTKPIEADGIINWRTYISEFNIN